MRINVEFVAVPIPSFMTWIGARPSPTRQSGTTFRTKTFSFPLRRGDLLPFQNRSVRAGWYDSSRANQLLKFGWYRPDYLFGQERQQIATAPDGGSIYGWLPIKPHKGIDHNAPAVLVTAGAPFIDILPTVVFIVADRVDEAIRDWGKIVEEAKLVKIPNYAYINRLEPQEFDVRF